MTRNARHATETLESGRTTKSTGPLFAFDAMLPLHTNLARQATTPTLTTQTTFPFGTMLSLGANRASFASRTTPAVLALLPVGSVATSSTTGTLEARQSLASGFAGGTPLANSASRSSLAFGALRTPPTPQRLESTNGTSHPGVDILD